MLEIDTGDSVLEYELTEADWFDMARQVEPLMPYAVIRASWLEFQEFVKRKHLH